MNRFRHSLIASFLFALGALVAAGASGCADQPTDEAADTGTSKEVSDAVAALPDAEVHEVGADGLPNFVRGDFGRLPSGGGASARAAIPSLERVAPLYRLAPGDLRLERVTDDPLGYQHFRYRPQIGGEDVIGAEVVVHVDPKGLVYATHGNARRGEPLARESLAAARRPTPADLGLEYAGSVVKGNPELVYVLSALDQKVYRAWSLVVEGERGGAAYKNRVFVDVRTSRVVDVHPLLHNALNRRIHSGNNTSTLPGTLKRTEGQAPNADAIVNANYTLLGDVYGCYQELFGRDSYDGAGAQLVSTVHHMQNFVNAFWDSDLSQMVYGDGDGVDASSLALSFDVTAHELTHAVTDRESGLVYENESGGINEALSDIFGAVCEVFVDGAVSANTWKIGESVWTPATAGDALRYMDDPTKDEYSRDFYPERIPATSFPTQSNDYGGVHGNSGIANQAFYLLTVGGKHVRNKTPNVTVPALGIEKARQIWYRANTTYLTPSSNFQSLRTALRQAATDLFGATEAAAVDLSMDAVGVPGGAPQPQPTTSLVNGQALTGQGATKGSSRFYSIDLPAGATNIRVTTSGGTGDADLYGKLGSLPSGSSNATFKSEGATTAETITIPNGTTGKLFLQLFAFTAYNNVTIKAEFAGAQPGGNVLQNGVPVGGVTGAKDSRTIFTFDVPSGATNLRFRTNGGTPDADLYVKRGAEPTTSSFDFRSTSGTNTETISPVAASIGKYFVMVHGFTNYSGLTLTASFTP